MGQRTILWDIEAGYFVLPAQRMIWGTWFTPYPFGIPQRAAWVVR